MKHHNIELPDGRLISIESEDAESVAKILLNHYLRPSNSTPHAAQPTLNVDNEGLPLPAMTFEAPALNASGAGSRGNRAKDDEGLALPALKF